MEVMQDYYELLGVPHDASIDDIKRAYTRKRREYMKNQDMTLKLTEAQSVLFYPEKKTKYDIKLRFGKALNDIIEKIDNCTSREQLRKYYLEKRQIYLDILNLYPNDIDALINLADIEIVLENNEQALKYLSQLEELTKDEEKINIYQRVAGLFEKMGNMDSAIKYYYLIYKSDITYVTEIKKLVRILYENMNNLKETMLILSDCINKSTDSRIKIIYLCEILRAIRRTKNSAYKQVEEAMYKKLESFRSDDEQINLANAEILVSCISDFMNDEDFAFFHKLEAVFLSYEVKNTECTQLFEALQRSVKFFEEGKSHKAIELYMGKEWTSEIKEEFARLIMKEAEQIKESLECIKKEIPEYWEEEKNAFSDLEELINEYIEKSREYNLILNDRSISYFMKKIIECIFLQELVAFDDIKDVYIEAKDSFFEKEDKGMVQHTLRKMEQCYPIWHKSISDIFFEGKSVAQIWSKTEKYANENVYVENGPTSNNMASNSNEKTIAFIIGMVFVVILCISCPPIGIVIYLIIKWLDRSTKVQQDDVVKIREENIRRQQAAARREENKKIFKTILIVVLIVAAIWITFAVVVVIMQDVFRVLEDIMFS